MTEQHHNHFHVGQIIENHPFAAGDGAVLEMFRNDMTNVVFIGLENITEDEQQLLAESGAEFGVLSTENGGCLVVLKLGDLAFDIQFNAAVIPNEFFAQPAEDTASLTLNMMAIDTQSNEMKVIREFSLPTEVSHKLIDVVNKQREIEDVMAVNAENMHLLNTISTEELLKQITLTQIQSVIAPSCSCGHDHHHHH